MHGILLITLFSCAAFYIAQFPFFLKISFSPLIIGILLGMLYANSLRNRLPETWVPGIKFCSKQILRLGIILYGFRLTLTSVGSAICGAAAVLGADATLKPKAYKTAVAVSTVVIFGTISMFLYPALYRSGLLGLDEHQMGIYTGSTLHEVAHVVGAGNAMGAEVEDTAIIVKMMRVILLVPVLLVLAFWASRQAIRGLKAKAAIQTGITGKANLVEAGPATASIPAPTESAVPAEKPHKQKARITVPWFAFLFLAAIGFNSLNLLPLSCVNFINSFDTFLLTMAMTALGTDTSFDKFKQAGPRPFLLAALLYIWLLGGGYLLARFL